MVHRLYEATRDAGFWNMPASALPLLPEQSAATPAAVISLPARG
jgi:hypothetical protein